MILRSEREIVLQEASEEDIFKSVSELTCGFGTAASHELLRKEFMRLRRLIKEVWWTCSGYLMLRIND